MMEARRSNKHLGYSGTRISNYNNEEKAQQWVPPGSTSLRREVRPQQQHLSESSTRRSSLSTKINRDWNIKRYNMKRGRRRHRGSSIKNTHWLRGESGWKRTSKLKDNREMSKPNGSTRTTKKDRRQGRTKPVDWSDLEQTNYSTDRRTNFSDNRNDKLDNLIKAVQQVSRDVYLLKNKLAQK